MFHHRFFVSCIIGLACAFCYSSAQDLTRSFSLYIETENGLKDTLLLGIGPNGLSNCDYDTTLCEPVPYPFDDTATHVGAFIVPKLKYHRNAPERYAEISCPVYLKKRIGRYGDALTILLPAERLPITIRWNPDFFQDSLTEHTIILDCYYDDYPCTCGSYNWSSSIIEEFTLQTYSEARLGQWRPDTLTREDSLYYFVLVPDSSGVEHTYYRFFVYFREISRLDLDEVQKENNPVILFGNSTKTAWHWQSNIGVIAWQIFDTNGKQRLSGRGLEGEISSIGLPSGLYLFRWQSIENRQGVKKLIKL